MAQTVFVRRAACTWWKLALQLLLHTAGRKQQIQFLVHEDWHHLDSTLLDKDEICSKGVWNLFSKVPLLLPSLHTLHRGAPWRTFYFHQVDCNVSHPDGSGGGSCGRLTAFFWWSSCGYFSFNRIIFTGMLSLHPEGQVKIGFGLEAVVKGSLEPANKIDVPFPGGPHSFSSTSTAAATISVVSKGTCTWHWDKVWELWRLYYLGCMVSILILRSLQRKLSSHD